MKKILIPVKASEELPEEQGKYIIELSPQTALKADYIPNRGWLTYNQPEIWYKEIPEEEYLREKLEELSQYLDNTASETSHLHLDDIDEYLKSKL